jgi:hypothetical protein
MFQLKIKHLLEILLLFPHICSKVVKKAILIFWLSFLPITFTYSQSEVELDCNLNLESIFKTHNLKIRYEAVQYIYKEYEKNRRFPKNSLFLNKPFELIRGYPLYIEKQKDSVSIKLGDSIKLEELVKVEWMSEEETDRYVEQLHCTPEEAFKEYHDLIPKIKSKKEIYLKCINEELAKGDSSKYVNDFIFSYDFIPSSQSVLPRLREISKTNFLKVFKEFILNDNEEVLPEGLRIYAYLKCNCKI